MFYNIENFNIKILRLNRILQLFNVNGDDVIDFMNERKQYEKTIEDLNEKIITCEKNAKIMEGIL